MRSHLPHSPGRPVSRPAFFAWRWTRRACCGFLLSLITGAVVAGAEIAKAYQVKAAFLYSFTKFVNWAPQRFTTDDSPIVVGVLGSNPFGDELEKILESRKVNGRPFVLKIIGDPSEATSVDLLFVPLGQEKRLAHALASINAAGVLTIGESEQFCALGGMITFTMDVDKVRFEINRTVVEGSGLRISAQLLKLATVVNRPSPPTP